MTIKQLSIFIENKSGTLIKVLDMLSKAGIQIIHRNMVFSVLFVTIQPRLTFF